jgi:predicted phage gp36 major capsid-like protein
MHLREQENDWRGEQRRRYEKKKKQKENVKGPLKRCFGKKEIKLQQEEKDKRSKSEPKTTKTIREIKKSEVEYSRSLFRRRSNSFRLLKIVFVNSGWLNYYICFYITLYFSICEIFRNYFRLHLFRIV